MPTVPPTILSLLRTLHQSGRLLPLLREASALQLVVAAAREAGLAVSAAELQAASDQFRQRLGLSSADATFAWLNRESLAPLDLQANVENELLREKFKHHLATQQTGQHFDAHRDRYARARVRLLVAPSEGEARERLAQLNDEGRDFAELARRHSLHAASRAAGGDLGEVFRCHLPKLVADALFAAQPGEVVGPFPGEGGFCIFRLESLAQPTLDEASTVALIRSEIFADWLRQRLTNLRLELSWLDQT